MREPVGRVVRLPTVQALRAEPTVIHPIAPLPPHTDDAAIPNADLETTTV
jgi:hypothetical protein